MFIRLTWFQIRFYVIEVRGARNECFAIHRGSGGHICRVGVGVQLKRS